MSAKTHAGAEPVLFDPAILIAAAGDAVRKLAPAKLMRNPVIFVRRSRSPKSPAVGPNARRC